MRRNYKIEALQIFMAIAIIALSVVLFFKSTELTILYPVVFGLSSLLSVIYALEGTLFNKTRVVRKSRMAVFLVVAILLAMLSFFSARTVLR